MLGFGFALRVWVAVAALSIPTAGAGPEADSGPELELTIHCPESEIKHGDKIPIVFTITNRGKSAYAYHICEYERRASTCVGQYKLVAEHEDGVTAVDPHPETRPYYGIWGGYDRGEGKEIGHGESFSKTAVLNQWALIRRAGRYTVTGTYYAESEFPSAKRRAVESTAIEITVAPRSDEEMADYVGGLSKRLQMLKTPLSSKQVEEKDSIVERLAYTCDERIVPTLIDWLYKYPYGSGWVDEAFVHYLPREPRIKNTVLEAAKKRGATVDVQRLLGKLGCSMSELREVIDLSLTIHCPKSDVKQGDEIPIVFTITNKGKSPYSYRYESTHPAAWMHHYRLVARRGDGTAVWDPSRKEPYVGGDSGPAYQGKIDPGESFSREIVLNLYALINEPGVYTVTGTYGIDVHSRRREQMHVDSEPIEIVVEPRSDQEMGDYVRDLIRKLEAISIPEDEIGGEVRSKMEREREDIVRRLAYTYDRRVAPTLINLLYQKRSRDATWARKALVCYLPRDPEIKGILLDAAKKRGLPFSMKSALEALGCNEEEFKEVIKICLSSEDPDVFDQGLSAAQSHPDDEYNPQLIAVATGTHITEPNRHLRIVEHQQAIHALAKDRTDEGVEALKALLKDPNERIRRSTREAILRAYKEQPVYPKEADDEFTAALVKMGTDFNEPYLPYVYEIIKTRTEEGVEAIKALVEDPNRSIPIVETDEGVKAIGRILRHPNKEYREAVAGMVRAAYRTYPGRPLRKDDFPELFRANLEREKARKDIFLEWVRKRNNE